MFIVIQEIQLKKDNAKGAYKKYKVDSFSFNLNGTQTTPRYTYNIDYSLGQFERPHREAYKISLHHSYRENGKVKKKQCVIGTLGYYTLAENRFIYEFLESGMNKAYDMFELSEDYNLYDMVMGKLESIIGRIQTEYRDTEEYKEVQERDNVLNVYRQAKAKFAEDYHVEESEYDCCYDVFGNVMNKRYLNKIIKQAKQYDTYSSYSNSSSSNYNYDSYSGCSTQKQDSYNDDEKLSLKQFYKVLSMKFHPDMNRDNDTTKEMQLLNKLKESWGL